MFGFMVAPDSAPSDSLPSDFRASDEDRDDVIRLLRDGSVDGRLSNETFLRRVDRALRARGMAELAELLSDLPPVPPEGSPPRSPAGRAARFTAWLRGIRLPPLRFQVTARPPALILPRGPRTVFTIGRSPDCDLALGDITVSWHHAELRHDGQAWVLADLGSTNGTRVNGWRADSGFTVRPGDWVSFGRATFRVTD